MMAWVYPHLFRAAEKNLKLEQAASPVLTETQQRRLLAQARREILLAQATDWPFMMNAGRHVAYAEKRVCDHLTRFYWLAEILENGMVDETKLQAIESVDSLFHPEVPAYDVQNTKLAAAADLLIVEFSTSC